MLQIDFKKNNKFVRRHWLNKFVLVFADKKNLCSYDTKQCTMKRMKRFHFVSRFKFKEWLSGTE